jgi:hypothetical protein
MDQQSPSELLQNKFNAKNLPYGAQYEINRLVSVEKLTYDDILLEDIDNLAKMGTNREAAPATAKLMLKHSFEADDSDGMPVLFHTTATSHFIFNRVREDFCQGTCRKSEELLIHSTLCRLTKVVKSPWEEFDREEEALRKNPYGGLGFDENKEFLGWHGGQVLFHAKLHNVARDRKSCTPQYKLTLEPAELSSSHSFARRFGSKHFLRMKLTKSVVNKHSKKLLDYLRRPLILCGGVFRAFFAKESNVFYVKTNEGTDGKSILSNVSVPNIMSVWEFINWHNPIELNSKQVSKSLWIGVDFPLNNFEQTMAKYASRFALGLSNSVPGIMVEPSNLRFIEDISQFPNLMKYAFTDAQVQLVQKLSRT